MFGSSELDYFKEHPEFNEEFEVFSETEEEAYRLLCPQMIKTLCDLKNRWDAPVYLSFVKNKIYVAITTPSGFLTSDIKEDVTETKHIKNLFEELTCCFSIIESLNETKKIPIDINPAKNLDTPDYENLKIDKDKKNRFM